MKLYLLDTNMFSYIATGKSQGARTRFQKLAADSETQLMISVITEAEVHYGMNKRAVSPQRRYAIEGLMANFEILPWGSAEAIAYAGALPELETKGIGVSQFDFMIGVQAATAGAVLVSHDKIFTRIADTVGIHSVVDWAKDM